MGGGGSGNVDKILLLLYFEAFLWYFCMDLHILCAKEENKIVILFTRLTRRTGARRLKLSKKTPSFIFLSLVNRQFRKLLFYSFTLTISQS